LRRIANLGERRVVNLDDYFLDDVVFGHVMRSPSFRASQQLCQMLLHTLVIAVGVTEVDELVGKVDLSITFGQLYPGS
jgi:hypothetical protein